MNLIAFDIPETHAELARWLEQRLVGPDLAALVAELSAVHGTEGRTTTLSEAANGRLNQALNRGLEALPPAALRRLLLEPRLLLDLQEAVLCEGGAHWDHVTQSVEKHFPVEQSWKSLRRAVEKQARKRPVEEPSIRLAARPTWYRRQWFSGFTAAAAVLIAVVLFRDVLLPTPEPAPTGWGWSKSGALAQNVPADQYLTSLADSAKQWFNKKPDNSADLAKRIIEFRQGCSTLLLAEHRPLAAADRQWLLERCRVWSEKLDQHLKSVEAGEDPAKIRAQTDETVNKLVAALEARAKGVAKA